MLMDLKRSSVITCHFCLRRQGKIMGNSNKRIEIHVYIIIDQPRVNIK